MPLYTWEIIIAISFGALLAAGFFEWGRASMRAEIEARWRLATCKECGNFPLPTMIHRSGCMSGWPPSGTQENIREV